MHEKMLYIEALRKGFAALGRTCHVTNMTKLEQGGMGSMPASGPTLVLGEWRGVRGADLPHRQYDRAVAGGDGGHACQLGANSRVG